MGMVTYPECGHFFSDRRHASCPKCPPPNKATNQPSQEIASPPPQQITSPPPQQMANQPSTTPGAPHIPLEGVNLRDVNVPKGIRGVVDRTGASCVMALAIWTFGFIVLIIPIIGWLIAIGCFFVGFVSLTGGAVGSFKITTGTFDCPYCGNIARSKSLSSPGKDLYHICSHCKGRMVVPTAPVEAAN